MALNWDEKAVTHESSHLENASCSSPSDLKGSAVPSNEDEVLSRWSLDDQRRILRKVDVRLIPICGLMYCVSLLDRTNLSNAAIAGYVVL
jgi:hypothetical protein